MVKASKETKEKITLLIDGDIVCYQIAVNHEHEVNFEPDDPDSPTILFSYASDCIPQFDKYIDYLKQKLKAESVVICFSGPDNFRKTVYKDYKANRVKTRKPIAYREFKQQVSEKYCTITKPTLEADDVLGIISTLDSKQFMGKRIIVSIDKDLEQIPGYIFNPDKDDSPRKISKEQAMRRFWIQTLSGDATDGYPGCKGIGAVKAERLVDETPEEDMWEAIVKTYAKAGFDEEFALSQARCAKLLTAENYDFKTSKVILWNPK